MAAENSTDHLQLKGREGDTLWNQSPCSHPSSKRTCRWMRQGTHAQALHSPWHVAGTLRAQCSLPGSGSFMGLGPWPISGPFPSLQPSSRAVPPPHTQLDSGPLRKCRHILLFLERSFSPAVSWRVPPFFALCVSSAFPLWEAVPKGSEACLLFSPGQPCCLELCQPWAHVSNSASPFSMASVYLPRVSHVSALGPGPATEKKRQRVLKSYGWPGKTSPRQRKDFPPCSPDGTAPLCPWGRDAWHEPSGAAAHVRPAPAPHRVTGKPGALPLLRHRASPFQLCPSQLINTLLMRVFRHVYLM
ncbi:uncharacterized protein [Callorhinus ursinus]|uniref:uncharacterized protein n=1 Tax=Callorhinus ursinus TaxID=34884 RepID=UPI003CD048A0